MIQKLNSQNFDYILRFYQITSGGYHVVVEVNVTDQNNNVQTLQLDAGTSTPNNVRVGNMGNPATGEITQSIIDMPTLTLIGTYQRGR